MGGPTHEEKRRTFECHFLLRKLSREEIDTLLHYARVEHHPAGYEIYAKGSPGQSMMAVSSGTVKSGCTASGPDRFQAFGALACQLPSLPHAEPPDTRPFLRRHRHCFGAAVNRSARPRLLHTKRALVGEPELRRWRSLSSCVVSCCSANAS
jgi:CRP-like cAMP-binding protein